MTIKELNQLSERDFIATLWGNEVLSAIDNQHTSTMSMKDFLSHCTACGGDWGTMLLTGVRELWPEVYDAIPDNMGTFAWACICNTIRLLGVKTEEEV